MGRGVSGRRTTDRPAWAPPPYPYDRLDGIKKLAAEHDGGLVDLSVGTPCDPPPPAVLAALSGSASADGRGYPPSIGSPALREAAAGWLARRFGVAVSAAAPLEVAACVGAKEFVATLPQWLRLRAPSRDTVLYPAISYPTYAMGAELAGCRPVPVPCDDHGRIDLDAVDPADAARALCLWVNTPGNPAGGLDDLEAAAAFGRTHGVPVFSDECYVEFTWAGPGRTVLSSGLDGVVAVHSLSKRSNLAGLRVGFYAGDAELVTYLSEVRKHAGMMVSGPVQAAAAVALADDAHVDEQRRRYRERLDRFTEILTAVGIDAARPDGGFYLWVGAPAGDGWGLAERLAREGGVLVTPGDTFGPAGAGWVRVAMVQPLDRLDLVAGRLGVG
jgi:succinyldiaminopimelate transaminase